MILNDLNSELNCLPIAPPPEELVQQGLVAPHRAIALACFSIGLPRGLLKRLGPFRKRPSPTIPSDQKRDIVEWELHFAELSTVSWRHVLFKVMGDVVIMACTAAVLQRAWTVNKSVMVPWKCETPVMSFAWTAGCMVWVLAALLLLHAMVVEIRFEHLSDSSVTYRW